LADGANLTKSPLARGFCGQTNEVETFCLQLLMTDEEEEDEDEDKG
jgi:hypothetical protein